MIEEELRANGWARAGQVLTAAECHDLQLMYDDESHFRSRISMERYRFGRGEYQYFRDPLPAVVQRLREAFYSQLAPLACEWMPAEYPSQLNEFLQQCSAAGQLMPTPLMLRYETGDYNCLHQDLYGPVVFPFQVIVALSAVGVDYRGGELLLVEQRPRAQSMGRAIVLEQGEAVVITTRHRPVRGVRGVYRASVRHGVSPVLEGRRFTLGVIFHNAE